MARGNPPRLTGRALKAAVTAAESPMLGAGFKQLMFKQLGIDALMEIDLSDVDAPPWSLPRHEPTAPASNDD